VIAYALGILSEHDMVVFERELKRHPQYAREVKRYLNVLATLVISEVPVDVAAISEHELLACLRRSRLIKV